MKATNLTPEQIEALRERARREAGPFVNPAITSSFRPHNPEWSAEILGEHYDRPRRLLWWEVYLLYIAAQEEPSPPPPPLATARRLEFEKKEEERREAEKEKWRAKWADWESLKKALEEAGTRVTVRHNYTSHRHLDGYVQGVDHIYLKEPLNFGRLRRDSDIVLCWTPSRAKDLEYFPVEGEYEDRVPNCKACLKIARSIADRVNAQRGR